MPKNKGLSPPAFETRLLYEGSSDENPSRVIDAMAEAGNTAMDAPAAEIKALYDQAFDGVFKDIELGKDGIGRERLHLGYRARPSPPSLGPTSMIREHQSPTPYVRIGKAGVSDNGQGKWFSGGASVRT